MIVYVVLYDRPVGLMCQYRETEIVDIFKYQIDAEECARESKNYRIEEWYVSGA